MRYIIFLSLIFILNLDASVQDEYYKSLKKTQKDVLNYSYKKAKQDSLKLQKDWVNPIFYTYTYNKGDKFTTKKSSINISQPIFKSGGIYYAIKYVKSMKKFTKTNIDIQKKQLIKNLISLLFNIKNIDINIQKQQLLIQNSKIDIEKKQEQTTAGTLDTSFLDNAILALNIKQNALIDLNLQRQNLLNQLSTMTDKSYQDLPLPIFSIRDKKDFLNKNIYLKKEQQDIKNNKYIKKMTTANYLPSVNFTANYSKYHDLETKSPFSSDWEKNIGFNIKIPFDIKYSNKIQSAKLQYLKKKSDIQNKKNQEILIYKNALAKIKSLDQKIKISQQNVELYNSLLTQMIDLNDAGIKSQTDVNTMRNSKQIKILDIKNLKIQKQLQLLEIYSRINDG
jgi:outer membrane protein TolC